MRNHIVMWNEMNDKKKEKNENWVSRWIEHLKEHKDFRKCEIKNCSYNRTHAGTSFCTLDVGNEWWWGKR